MRTSAQLSKKSFHQKFHQKCKITFEMPKNKKFSFDNFLICNFNLLQKKRSFSVAKTLFEVL